MTLAAWLERIEQLHPEEIELGLERVQAVAQRLALDLRAPQLVVVAGTNGKGSTVAALQSILLKHGLSVASYTSPHLQVFNERIVLDGEPVDDDTLCHAFSEVERARNGVALTYFEFTTLAALYCFSQYQPHICLLEVGLGGRLDAVNIVDAELVVVTNIQLDHENWLGTDRDAIAREKAGVFRTGVPVICAEAEPPEGLLDAASEKGVNWLQKGVDFFLQQDSAGWRWRGRDSAGSSHEVCGQGQLALHPDALAAAIQACYLLLEQPRPALVSQALEGLDLGGRCQFLDTRYGSILLDVAHNPAAMKRLAEVLKASPVSGKTHIIFAMLEGKRVAECAAALQLYIDGDWWLPQLRAGRARSCGDVASDIAPCRYRCMTSTDEALECALSALEAGDRLLVAGSFYTVSETMASLARRGISFE